VVEKATSKFSKQEFKPRFSAGLFYAYFYPMSKVIVECCANSVQSAINGQAGGAERIELCANLEQGGTTPSAASICLAREALEVDLYVLIRPRAGNFVYSELELEEIIQDIEFCKEIGCDGVVVGVLNADGSVNEQQTKTMVQAAQPMGVTFHRAFDVAKDVEQALESIIKCGCERLLTSGQATQAIEGVKVFQQLVAKANNRIEIMAGSGVNANNVLTLYPLGIRQFHLSGTDVIAQEENAFSFGSKLLQTNPQKIQEVADALEGLA
jgi:copper homeostasis protein